MAIKLSDLPPHVQAQIQRKLDAEKQATKPPSEPGVKPEPKSHRAAPKGPTKTEAAYRLEILDRNPAVRVVGFEAITVRLANGHRYTPDWCFVAGDRLHLVEVKGSYRLGSYQRARLAFDQARIEHPWAVWIWAERTKEGGWKHD